MENDGSVLKVLVFSKNAPWGVIRKADGSLKYKHVMRFADDTKRVEFVKEYLLTDTQKTTLGDSPLETIMGNYRAYDSITDRNLRFRYDVTSYEGNYRRLLSADFAIVYLNGAYIYYALKVVAANPKTVTFLGEIDIFFTYKINFREESANFLVRGHTNRIEGNTWKEFKDLEYFYNVDDEFTVDKSKYKVLPFTQNGNSQEPEKDIYWRVYVFQQPFSGSYVTDDPPEIPDPVETSPYYYNSYTIPPLNERPTPAEPDEPNLGIDPKKPSWDYPYSYLKDGDTPVEYGASVVTQIGNYNPHVKVDDPDPDAEEDDTLFEEVVTPGPYRYIIIPELAKKPTGTKPVIIKIKITNDPQNEDSPSNKIGSLIQVDPKVYNRYALHPKLFKTYLLKENPFPDEWAVTKDVHSNVIHYYIKTIGSYDIRSINHHMIGVYGPVRDKSWASLKEEDKIYAHFQVQNISKPIDLEYLNGTNKATKITELPFYERFKDDSLSTKPEDIITNKPDTNLFFKYCDPKVFKGQFMNLLIKPYLGVESKWDFSLLKFDETYDKVNNTLRIVKYLNSLEPEQTIMNIGVEYWNKDNLKLGNIHQDSYMTSLPKAIDNYAQYLRLNEEQWINKLEIAEQRKEISDKNITLAEIGYGGTIASIVTSALLGLLPGSGILTGAAAFGLGGSAKGLFQQRINREEAAKTRDWVESTIKSVQYDAAARANTVQVKGNNLTQYFTRLDFIKENIFYARYPQDDVLMSINKYYNEWGYGINQSVNLNTYLDSRKVWNYVEAKNTFNTLDEELNNLSSPIKQIINNAFSEGIFFWHFNDIDSWKGTLCFNKFNWER